MAEYDFNHDKAYCVEQCLFKTSQGQVPAPRIILKPSSFIESLINGLSFECVQIKTEKFHFTFFKTEQEASDYLDALSLPLQ